MTQFKEDAKGIPLPEPTVSIFPETPTITTTLDIREEKDPKGLAPNDPGAKLDYGKLRPSLVKRGFINALQEVWKDGTYGAAKYSDDGWKQVPDGINRYLDAADRHYDKYLKGEMYDEESGVHHLGAVAWNILAVLELELTK